MERRKFLKRLTTLTSGTLALNHIPVRVFSENSRFMDLAGLSDNDRVLVILQLHGGNDGLNMVIPAANYDEYYSRRANIAIPAKNSKRKYIPLDTTLPTADQVGLHPDMMAAKDLYDRNRMGVIQGVSYPYNNGSHFRGRDIFFMGGGVDDYKSSGWIGRYLSKEIEPSVYPDDFPNAENPDPLAIELGNSISLIFHQEGNIPASISLPGNPESFSNLVENLDGFKDKQLVDPIGTPPSFLDESPYGKELNWILGLEDKTQDYAKRLYEVYAKAPESTVVYPDLYPFDGAGNTRNPLSGQLQIISKLLDGGGDGVKTKVFLLRIGGFDTHAGQVETYDPTLGSHAAKMYHITTAMQAFQNDLKARGIEDRVLTITTSEFGRRISSNGSYGTDHGTGAPLLMFGTGVKAGVYGTNPDMSKNNVEMQHDYRQVFASVLKDWMQVDEEVVNNDIFFGDFIDGVNAETGENYEPLDIVGDPSTDVKERKTTIKSINAYPNPARDQVRFEFSIQQQGLVKLYLTDMKGKIVKRIIEEDKLPGEYQQQVDVANLASGSYFYHLEIGKATSIKLLTIIAE